MKKLPVIIVLTVSCTATLLQCSSSKKRQKEAPFSLGQTYYKQWGTGPTYGATIFITVNNKPSQIVLDSVYYKNRGAKLHAEPNNPKSFIGKFNPQVNKDIIMSSDPKAEYGNTLMQKVQLPQALKENECLISYKDNNITKYFTVNNVIEK